MKVEYLVIIDSESTFCRSSKSFKNFLQSDSEINISNSKIKFRNISIDYELQEGENSNKNNKFFHIKLACEEKDLLEFSDLCRSIKKLLHMNSKNSVQTLWDDISFYYSSRSYPMIYEIENSMRKLITKFMLTNVGLGWTKETVPEELKKSSRTENIDNINYLYETDFIQLSNFLFDEYRTLDITALIKKISEIDTDTVHVNEIHDFIPKSNWERYFQSYVDCEGSYLKVRWEKLYKLRCKIAHNNTFTKPDYEQTERLVNEVKSKLLAAIQSLDKITVNDDEKEDLAEIAASNASIVFGNFIQKWKILESLIIEILIAKEILPNQLSKREKSMLYKNQEALIKHGIIDSKTYKEIKTLNKVRNIMVHETEQHFTDSEIMMFSRDIDRIIEFFAEKLSI
ncbi:HEPN domain-containing protein [Kosakonia oryzendophytica]|uniref:HEPN domain-containing protein n=1 Tax=Kosakonia oryzendophytica TaxID=1005665 RepID=UPI000A985382|nr:HEPN domain-containing protein [Kosakonia oryzendophytica]WBT59282.1 HEPN domain-containing protein [Kosakonia oryzendophytica]